MSTAHIRLASFPSLCQKFSQLVEFDKVLTKIIFTQFFRHGVYKSTIEKVNETMNDALNSPEVKGRIRCCLRKSESRTIALYNLRNDS